MTTAQKRCLELDRPGSRPAQTQLAKFQTPFLGRTSNAPLSRRDVLRLAACGFGQVALAGLLGEESRGAASANPLSPKQPHFPARARRVIFLFMHGGVSHVDSFDHKPKLAEMNGKPLPIPKPKFEFAPTGNLLASPWKFSKYGQSGVEVSELFPEIGSVIDEICVVRSMNGGDQVSHGPALLNINTGSGVFARPSMGAWTLYGLGTENQNLPGFISLSPSLYHGGGAELRFVLSPGEFSGDADRGRKHSSAAGGAFESPARRRPRAPASAA